MNTAAEPATAKGRTARIPSVKDRSPEGSQISDALPAPRPTNSIAHNATGNRMMINDLNSGMEENVWRILLYSPVLGESMRW